MCPLSSGNSEIIDDNPPVWSAKLGNGGIDIQQREELQRSEDRGHRRKAPNCTVVIIVTAV